MVRDSLPAACLVIRNGRYHMLSFMGNHAHYLYEIGKNKVDSSDGSR